ncbi:MAG TPA: CopG family transcriptional regulator [Candidatus Hydrogenedentes bacterium]|nr:CopG family transcriptional regulator [Candidatus Hydrogenedentota bacterium]
MSTMKIAVTMEAGVLEKLDRLVSGKVFPYRSRAVQAAVEEKLARLSGARLAMGCAKLDKREEQAMADEGINIEEDSWPEH